MHDGIQLQFDGERHHLPMSELTGTLDRDLRPDRGRQGPDRRAPRERSAAALRGRRRDACTSSSRSGRVIRYGHDGAAHELECDVIAGCDGFHGVCRPSIPDGVLKTFEREYPFGWLGILAEVAPSIDELVYAHHERGFALLSLRSPELSRCYLQVRHDEDIAEWPDERIWEELQLRTALDGWTLARGPDPREGRHRHAQLRHRADAVRPPLPRGRRGAHRPADGRQGAEPRDADVRIARRGARPAGTGTATRRCSTRTRSRACAASGAPSTSRAG